MYTVTTYMISEKGLSLSIVIPAYNEEVVLGACLHAIGQQTVKPDEVIVVNNNSSDATQSIARSFSFVKVVNEPTQGIIAAHHSGFRHAKGDIIARIDADTVMSKNWVARVKKRFNASKRLDAITGPGAVYELAIEELYPGEFFSKYYFALGRGLFGLQLLWGSNMAVRRSTWQKIESLTCHNERLVHDDVDISLLIHHLGGRIVYDRYLRVYVHGRRFLSPKKIAHYHTKIIKTRDYHIKGGTFIPRGQKSTKY